MRTSDETLDAYIGKQIRDKRIKRQMTLLDVAEAIGVSYQQIQKYERGITKISASTLYKLSNLFDIKLELFFKQFGNQSSTDNNSNINVLLVENNPSDEALARKALNEIDNIRILCVHNASQVFDFLKHKTLCQDFPRPHIIFLNIGIPGRDGISVLREIKLDHELQDIPVVILTNKVKSDLITKSYKYGASGYICKSFDFDIFRNNIIAAVNYWTSSVMLPQKAC